MHVHADLKKRQLRKVCFTCRKAKVACRIRNYIPTGMVMRCFHEGTKRETCRAEKKLVAQSSGNSQARQARQARPTKPTKPTKQANAKHTRTHRSGGRSGWGGDGHHKVMADGGKTDTVRYKLRGEAVL